MNALGWLLTASGMTLALYGAFVAWLYSAGRREDARAAAGFIPDCLVLCRRLIGDPRVSRQRKALLALLVAYLAFPIDLVPDFIPIAGQIDDVIVAALVLRAVLRGGGEDTVRELWPGPERSLGVLLRFGFGRPATASG